VSRLLLLMTSAAMMIASTCTVVSEPETPRSPTPGGPNDLVLRSLPDKVQRGIEEFRAGCRDIGVDANVTSGDGGLLTFTVRGRRAVLIDPILLCGECYHGVNCTNRGTRQVEVYVRGNSWGRELADGNITGDIFVSIKLGGSWEQWGQELNALVVNLFVGNRECPTRIAPSSSQQSWEARSCVIRWNGTRFTYKPL
jgi:hypothetical protein